jgi:HAMP domain-containing protein
MTRIELPYYRRIGFQLLAAFLALFVLFSAALGYGLRLAEARERDQVVVNTAARLQLVARMMQNQALNYTAVPARDYPTYFRDVRLYFDDLQAQIDTFDEAIGCFTSGRFETPRQNQSPAIYEFHASDHPTVIETVDTWKRFRAGLDQALGEADQEPRLEAAAEFIMSNIAQLQTATESLFVDFQREAQQRLAANHRLMRIVVITAVALLALTLWWAHRVLRPLRTAVEGFERVAQGDFGHQVPVAADNEIGVLTRSFNQMSERLESLVRLIDAMQEGRGLGESLDAVTEGLRRFMPVDWAGVLLLDSQRSELVLEAIHAPGLGRGAERQRFDLRHGAMAELIEHGKPVRIADLRLLRRPNEESFESMLVEADMTTAMLLPLRPLERGAGLLVFAAQAPKAYLLEHEELLSNLATLIGHGFEKTLALADARPGDSARG